MCYFRPVVLKRISAKGQFEGVAGSACLTCQLRLWLRIERCIPMGDRH